MLFLSLCIHLSFYNYKSLESSVAPNVALTPLPLHKTGQLSPATPSTSHCTGEEAQSEATGSRSRKRRATGDGQAASEPPSASVTASAGRAPQEDKDSEVEIEVESREECESPAHRYNMVHSS